ncbi:HNH endonuclease signature motif containing protein [Nocardia australiensis]|uniref:HNH endonuclease signature motif containing protein n=1 Tax=Nocardia australiensis TaxID=2887191 RepID=UPI001D14A754|nr:HNH endonuclease signature motif containing protein [Nocardia australiensis]
MRSSSEAGQQRVTDPLLTAVTSLLEEPLTSLSDDAVTDLLRDVERSTRMLTALTNRLTVEVIERHIPARVGAHGPKGFLTETLRLSGQEATRRIAAAHSLGMWHDMSGETHQPQHPRTAAALVAGDISADHAARIAAVLKRVPGSTSDPDFEAAEQVLAEHARTGSPDDIPKVGDAILAYLDPDGKLTDDGDRQRMRAVTIGRQRADGMSPIHGEITPTLRALLDPVLAKLARPGMNNPDDPESPSGNCEYIDRDAMVAAAARDYRTVAQRNHDGLIALLQLEIPAQRLGAHRGIPVSTILTMSVADVERAAGVATTATGGTIPVAEALKLAERAQPFLMVFDHRGVPLHFGRTKRLASAGQRLALIASIRGCTRPGCDAPASLCATHHVTGWNTGGLTDIGNETLACDHCHALIHDGPGGWKTLVLESDSTHPGRTAWIAPPHIDPTRTPRVNHRHHPGELLAKALTHIHDRDELHQRPRKHPPSDSNAA